MLRERARAAHMVNELMGFFQHHHIGNYSIHVAQDKERIALEIFGECGKLPPGLDELDVLLNKGRVPAMEEYYDQLLSLYDEKNGLRLLAMMVDRGEIFFGNGFLSIKVERDL